MSNHYTKGWPWLNLYEPHPDLSGYRPVLGSKGMVSSPHHAASAVGIDILKDGGNAVDAAIAVSAMLMVVCPMQCGPGGDAFWMINEPQGPVSCLNGAGYAPRSADPEMLRALGWSAIEPRSVYSVTVPGAIDSWIKAHERYGSIPFATLIEPAAVHAEMGFLASRHTISSFQTCGDELHEKSAIRLYSESGTLPVLYSRVTQPKLADCLREIARTNGRGFYEGELATAIALTCSEWGGWLSREDMSAYQSKWVDPISSSFREFDVYTAPPPSQGFGLLAALRAVEECAPDRLQASSPDTAHLLIEAVAYALELRDKNNGNDLDASVALELVKNARRFVAEFSLTRCASRKTSTGGSRKGDTAHLAVVDRTGFGVSLIQSLFFDFGSCIPVHTGGFTLQNRGAAFSLIGGHPGELKPRCQPPHTLMPTIVKRGVDLRFAMGCMGGDGQMQTQLQLLIDMCDGGLDPQQAVSRSRWYLDRSNSRVLHERGAFSNGQDLKSKGHELIELARFEEVMGHAQVIELREDGVLVGAHDPRSDGQVAAL